MRKLLDLCCGQGGAAKGYQRSGFFVVGVDIIQQPRYIGNDFILGDAFTILDELINGSKIASKNGRLYKLDDFDVIHTSPICKGYSIMSNCLVGYSFQRQIAFMRDLLVKTGKPYVIENVTGAKRALEHPVMLCGATFGLKVYRHRWFEIKPFIMVPSHIPHNDSTPKAGRGLKSPKGFISVAGHISDMEYCSFAMGIDWMTQTGLPEAIPPAYTEYIGKQITRQLWQSG